MCLEENGQNPIFTNLDVSGYNEKKLETLDSKLWKFNADWSGPPGYKPTITAHGTIDDTGLKNVLQIKS